MCKNLNVAALDIITMNDIEWRGTQDFASFVSYDLTPPELVAERAAGADAILINKIKLGEEQLLRLPNLKYIGVLATGYDVVDVAAARARGITVTNIPAYASRSVAQHVFALLLELTNMAGLHSRTVIEDKKWCGYPVFSYWERPLVELDGKTMGILGMGRIGEQVALIARAFGMRVIAHGRRERDIPSLPGLQWVSLKNLMRESDVISLHCPLTDETAGIINRDTLSLMKPTAYIINTSRGPLIDERDLRAALDSGGIAGAGLDVLAGEPPAPGNPMLGAKNCVITPHMAWASVEARTRLVETALQNLRAFAAGKPENVVS